jgi:hypothetical protein
MIPHRPPDIPRNHETQNDEGGTPLFPIRGRTTRPRAVVIAPRAQRIFIAGDFLQGHSTA